MRPAAGDGSPLRRVCGHREEGLARYRALLSPAECARVVQGYFQRLVALRERELRRGKENGGAGATQVIINHDSTARRLTVIDDGCGIEDFQRLLTFNESGWDEDTAIQAMETTLTARLAERGLALPASAVPLPGPALEGGLSVLHADIGKLTKAEELGIEVITEEQFVERLAK